MAGNRKRAAVSRLTSKKPVGVAVEAAVVPPPPLEVDAPEPVPDEVDSGRVELRELPRSEAELPLSSDVDGEEPDVVVDVVAVVVAGAVVAVVDVLVPAGSATMSLPMSVMAAW
jgi:hypothetical protein